MVRTSGAAILAFAQIVCAIQQGWGQQRVLKGEVRWADSNIGIAGARVSAVGMDLTTATDTAGKFAISLPVGTVTLRIRAAGATGRDVTVRPDDDSLLVKLQRVALQHVAVLGMADLAPLYAEPANAGANVWIAARGRVESLRSTISSISVSPGDYVVGVAARAPSIEHLSASSGNLFDLVSVEPGVGLTGVGGQAQIPAVKLPVNYVGTDQTGRSILHLKPFVVPRPGLHYTAFDERFRGSILIALVDSTRPMDAADLPSPGIQIRVLANADTVHPDPLRIRRTNRFERVWIVLTPPTDSIRVHVQPEFTPGASPIEVPVARPQVTVTANPGEIAAFGLERADVLIRVESYAARRPRDVTLSSDVSKLEPSPLRVDSTGMGTATIRSHWLGVATITASSPPLKEGSTRVSFRFPWWFLGSALVGGVVGALLRRSFATRAMSLWKYVWQGPVTGLSAAFVYVFLTTVGILPGKEVRNEAIVLFASMFGEIARSKRATDWLKTFTGVFGRMFREGEA